MDDMYDVELDFTARLVTSIYCLHGQRGSSALQDDFFRVEIGVIERFDNSV